MLANRGGIETISLVTEHKPRGQLEVVHGSMFGGKTEHMIAQLRQARAAGLRVIAFKHCIDDRYDEERLVTHRGDSFSAIRVPHAEAILARSVDVDLVAIDEGHFFKAALTPVVQTLLDRGVSVLVAGITNDSWGKPFDPMPQLAAMADREVLKQSPCSVCGKPSPFTQRMSEVDVLHMVGGLKDYEPRCESHFTPLSIPPEPR